MDHNTTTRTRLRARVLPRLAVAGVAALPLAALPSGIAGATPGTTWVVHEHESIQAAVDAAQSGDTILIEPGTYQEAVCVDGKGLTIVGAGRGEGGTAIVWPDWQTPADLPAVPSTPCWEAQDAADPESLPGLQDDVSALFFLDPDSPVVVRSLSTRNHPAHGIAAWGAHGFSVSDTSGYAHDRYGILAANSTGSRIRGNIETGLDRGTADQPNSGTAGISSGDSDNADATIANNRVEGFNLGIFVRESRSGRITGNTVTGNCVGINIFDDSATEVPDTSRNVPAGDWVLRGNSSIANNRFCLAGIGEVNASLRVSGTGVTVVNADEVDIVHNVIQDNVPSVDPATLQFPAGGLTLLTLPPFNNPQGIDPGPVTNVRVIANTITGNVPVDILLGWPPPLDTQLPPPGPGIVFHANTCGTSYPPGTADCGGGA
jgi:parallel beta-helix repeat protein